MALYNIRKVRSDEVDRLQSFLDNYWKKEHSLAKSKALLNWQHLNKEDNTYNFFIAENTETNEFDALIGYIPLSQYDKSLETEGNYWGAIWKIRADISNNEINSAGFFLFKKLLKLPDFQSYAAIGISDIAKSIYQISRIPVSYLKQYYLLNNTISDYKIANIFEKPIINSLPDTGHLEWKDSIDWNSIDLDAYYKPLKSKEYFKNRYSLHPIYKYNFIKIHNDIGDLVAILSCRKICIGNFSIIRIVDVLGKLEGRYYNEFQRILAEQNAEYIDFMNFGIESSVFKDMGFTELDIEGKNIIPNYFEPFERRNVLVEIAYKSIYSDYVAFKADSDQDRPNIL